MAYKCWFVDTTLGTGNDDGTTMDDAWQSLATALAYSGFDITKVNVIFIRRVSSHTMVANILAADDGTAAFPIIFMGWPRAAHFVLSSDWTNGSTAVVIDDADMDRSKHQGRYITGPDGFQYLITKVTDASNIVIDREYAGGTLANQAVTISADEDYAADMGTKYDFDDSAWTIKEAAYDADADDLPLIDGNSAAYNISFIADRFYQFRYIEALNCADTDSMFYCITGGVMMFLGCLIKAAVNGNITELRDNFIYLKRVIIEGSGSGSSQHGVYRYSGLLYISDCAIYNCGGYGIVNIKSKIYLDNVNIGVEVENALEDISTMAYPSSQYIGKDVKLGGNNGYVKNDNINLGSQVNVFIENYQKVLDAHRTWFTGGYYEKAAVSGEVCNEKLSADVLKIVPNVADFEFFDAEHHVCIMETEIEADIGSQTFGFWVFNDMAATINDITAQDDIWLEVEYVAGYDDTSEYVQAKVISTLIDIIDWGADADDWTLLSATINPAVASKVRCKIYWSKYSAAGTFFIDPQVVIS